MDGLGILTLVTLFGSYPVLDAPNELDLRLNVELYRPIHANRQLQLQNVGLQVFRKRLFDEGLVLHAGLVVSHASGHIEQLNEGLQTVRLPSPGWGLGLDLGARVRLGSAGPVRMTLDVDAAAMGYDRPFPAGGMRYNGMFRIGPGLAIDSVRYGQVSLGLRWLHLSNGHGLTPRNPSYEGVGLALRVALPF